MEISEIKTKLNNELNKWFPAQCNNLFTDFYLYFLPAKKNQIGNFIIAEESPGKNYKLALSQRLLKGRTVDQNFYTCLEALNRLPIIDY